jgi:hypothetical protein
LINYTESLDVTVWEIPKCEFSAWAPDQPASDDGEGSSSSSSSSSSGGGGGGGGGGGAPNATTKQFVNGRITLEGKEGTTMKYMIGGNSHSVKINKIRASEVDVVIKSVLIMDTIKLGEAKEYDVTEDGKKDIIVRVESITGDSAKLGVSLIGYTPTTATPTQETPQVLEQTQEQTAEQTAQPTEQQQTADTTEGKQKPKSMVPIIFTMTAILAILVIALVGMKKKKEMS